MLEVLRVHVEARVLGAHSLASQACAPSPSSSDHCFKPPSNHCVHDGVHDGVRDGVRDGVHDGVHDGILMALWTPASVLGQRTDMQ